MSLSTARRPGALARRSVSRPVELAVESYSGAITVSQYTLNLQGVRDSIEKNRGNRPIRPAMLKTYALRMLSGEWAFDLPTIVFTASDLSQHNGQHTRLAFVLAHQLAKDPKFASLPSTREFLTKRLHIIEIAGVSRSACMWLDSGMPRNAADQVAARDAFNRDDFADLIGSRGTKEQQDSRWATLFKNLSIVQQFAEVVTWKRILGELPRTNVGKFGTPAAMERLRIFEGWSVPASDFALRCLKAGSYKVMTEVKDAKKNDGSTVQKAKTIQSLGKRLGWKYLAPLWIFAVSAYGVEEGGECCQLIADVLSTPLHKDVAATINSDALISGSPALTAMVARFNSYPLNGKGGHSTGLNGADLQDDRFWTLLRTVKVICEGLEGNSNCVDEIQFGVIRDEDTNATLCPNDWRLGGLDMALPDDAPPFADECKVLVDWLRENPEPNGSAPQSTEDVLAAAADVVADDGSADDLFTDDDDLDEFDQ